MAYKIEKPTLIEAAGNKPKLIEEFFGCVNTQTPELSIARMTSPPGWQEPGQTPKFDEYTVVLRGTLRVETRSQTYGIAVSPEKIMLNGNDHNRFRQFFDLS